MDAKFAYSDNFASAVVNADTVSTGELSVGGSATFESIVLEGPSDTTATTIDHVVPAVNTTITIPDPGTPTAEFVLSGGSSDITGAKTFENPVTFVQGITIGTGYNVNGNVIGDVTGNLTGTTTGSHVGSVIGDIHTDNVYEITLNAGISINSTLKVKGGVIEGPITGDLYILTVGDLLVDSSIVLASGSSGSLGSTGSRWSIIYATDSDFSGDTNIGGNLTVGGTVNISSLTIPSLTANAITTTDLFSIDPSPGDSITCHTRFVISPGKSLFTDNISAATSTTGRIKMIDPTDCYSLFTAISLTNNSALSSDLSISASGNLSLSGGSITLSSQTASRVLATDASKNMVTMAYSQGSLANALVQMNATGDITAHDVTSGGRVLTNEIWNASGSKILMEPSSGAKGIDVYPQSTQTMTMAIRASSVDNGIEIGSVFTAGDIMSNTVRGDAVIANNQTTKNLHFGMSGAASVMYMTPSDVIIPNFGIRFGAGNPSLNVYTAGVSYTPTVGDGANNFTLSTAIGRYVRIAAMVTVDIWCIWSSKGAATSAVRISLPFGVGPGWRRPVFAIGFTNGVPFTGMMTCSGQNSQLFVNLIDITAAGVSSSITCASMAASGEIQLSGSYLLD